MTDERDAIFYLTTAGATSFYQNLGRVGSFVGFVM